MSGSETRQRKHQYIVRFDDDERLLLLTHADEAGLTPSSWLRQSGLKKPSPRAKRRPPRDETLLRQILAQCGKIGGNVNQMTRSLHIAKIKTPPEFTEARTAILAMRNTLFDALGVNRKDAPGVDRKPDGDQGKKPD
jgi:hypothetical protein